MFTIIPVVAADIAIVPCQAGGTGAFDADGIGSKCHVARKWLAA
jgi:hypothetical protein